MPVIRLLRRLERLSQGLPHSLPLLPPLVQRRARSEQSEQAPEVTQSAVSLVCQSLRSAYSFESTLSPRSAAMLRQRVS
jgi:hypothetical protein